MSFDYKWTKGYLPTGDDCQFIKGVLSWFDTIMNKADAEALGALQHSLSSSSRSLPEALGELASTVSLQPGSNLPIVDPSQLNAIAASWYGIGGDSMWVASSVLTPGQIHETMAGAVARVAEMRIESGRTIDTYCHCGYDWFHVEISEPVEESEVIRVWIYGPSNMACAIDPSATVSDADSRQRFDDLLARIEDEVTDDQINEAKNIALVWDCVAKQVYAGTRLARDEVVRVDGTVQIGEPTDEFEPALLSDLARWQRADREGVSTKMQLVVIDPASFEQWRLEFLKQLRLQDAAAGLGPAAS